MITYADIAHYKSISDAKIRFQKTNVIVGPNATGKSNLVDAIYFVHDCITEDLDTAITRRHGINSIRQWTKFRPYNITITLGLETLVGHGHYSLIIGSTRGSYRVLSEAGEWFGHDPLGNDSVKRTSRFVRLETGDVRIFTEHPSDLHRNIQKISIPDSELFATSVSGAAFYLSSLLIQPITDAIKSFSAYTIYPNTLREPRVISRHERLLADGSNLASILKGVNSGQSAIKERIMEGMRVVIPEISDIAVRSAGGYYVPLIKIGHSTEDAHFLNMSQISDGTLRILGLLTAFHQMNAPDVIALEEPEQMINPGLLPVLVDAGNDFLSGTANRYRQIFVTTHSPNLLDLVDPESIVWTTKEDGVTTFGNISARQLDLVRRNLFTPGEIMVSEGFLKE